MKHILSHIVAITLLALSPLIRAATETNIPHTFDSNGAPAGYTYAFGANTSWALDDSGSTICINFPTTGADRTVVISPAFTKLVGIKIYHGLQSSKSGKIKVYLSEDGETWGSALNIKDMYQENRIDATFPMGNYYVKIANEGSTPVRISRIVYTVTDCNCFPFEAEE